MKLSFEASGFLISRPAIPLAAAVSISGVDIYLFWVLRLFVYDVMCMWLRILRAK